MRPGYRSKKSAEMLSLIQMCKAELDRIAKMGEKRGAGRPLPGSGFLSWHERAEETRAFAGQVRDPVAKRLLLDIARSYERMGRS